MALSLRPTAAVYVCLIERQRAQADSRAELQPGTSTHTYHAKRFEITLGNSSVTMFVDGIERTVAPSSAGDRLLDHEGGSPEAEARPAAHLHMTRRARGSS